MMKIRALGGFGVLVAACMCVEVRAGEPVPPVPLRIVTLNVLEDIGSPGSSAFLNTGDFLTTNDVDGNGPNFGLNPDIVCLQECVSQSNLNAFRDQFLPGYLFYRVSSVDGGGNFNAMFVNPAITVIDADAIGNQGPRRELRLVVWVEGALKPLTIYCAHFKAFTDPSSQATRTAEANEIGEFVYLDVTQGADINGDNIRETPTNVIVAGDLNSNNNFDMTLNGLFTHHLNGMPTGILNLPYESIAGQGQPGQFIATFPSFGSRLDYVCLDEELAFHFDVDMSPGLSQDEINSIGFVYYSGDDGGMRSNGDPNATSFASDHRPVVVTVMLPGDPNAAFDPKDINHDDLVNAEDLELWENLWAVGLAPDVDRDFDVDLNDGAMIKECVREEELTDITN